MSLPLADIATENGPFYILTPRQGAQPAAKARIPAAPPAAGEQYRFHFDMTKCIGCKCCEVACNEQNNNPAGIRWRRVGEIESGSYPFTERLHLSMGCNHCLEPSCLKGCPVDAYHKDPANGLVLHSADMCIGCQYCTWNCPYGVPQYNPERGVVGKCDMCRGRLAEGREPACVNACPEGAIRIETVNVVEWIGHYATAANAPGMPEAEQTISTTRITLPENLPAEFEKADSHILRLEDPHWPLVVMTVLTQLSVGTFCVLWLVGLLAQEAVSRFASAAALGVGMLSLGASTLHLGRPAYAYRALKMWRRSWLSREVLLFGLFAMAASGYAAMLWLGMPGAGVLGFITALAGLAGVTASACIYLVPARPAWNHWNTPAEFYLAGLLLGPLFVVAISPGGPLLLASALAGAAGQLLNQGLKLLWLMRSEDAELRGSARLVSGLLAGRMLLRMGLLLAGGILLPLTGHPRLALATALGGELLGRYLFFVSVTPKNMARSFFGPEHSR